MEAQVSTQVTATITFTVFTDNSEGAKAYIKDRLQHTLAQQSFPPFTVEGVE